MKSNSVSFIEQIQAAWAAQESLLCVGFDPDPKRLPACLVGQKDAIFTFCKEIADATADLVCAFKPQFAYFAAQGAEPQLEKLLHYLKKTYPLIPIILDSKRGDIGSTAEQYAIETFERYGADAVTVSPYLGQDSVEAYLRYTGKGVIILCRTSNPGSADLQALPVMNKTGAEPLYLHVARLASQEWNTSGQVGLVVGATFPEEITRVRAIVGNMPLLIPGIGAQGGDIEATVKAGQIAGQPGTGMIINSSRAILYASAGADFASAARTAALSTRDAIRVAVAQCDPYFPK